MKKLLPIILFGTLLLPTLAWAQLPPKLETPITGVVDLLRTLDKAASWMLYILITVAVVFIIYAAFLYLTAAGETDKVKKAKDQLIYALVAVVIGILAKGLVYIITEFFGMKPYI